MPHFCAHDATRSVAMPSVSQRKTKKGTKIQKKRGGKVECKSTAPVTFEKADLAVCLSRDRKCGFILSRVINDNTYMCARCMYVETDPNIELLKSEFKDCTPWQCYSIENGRVQPDPEEVLHLCKKANFALSVDDVAKSTVKQTLKTMNLFKS